MRIRFETSEAEQLPYKSIPLTARHVSLIDHMHLFCCTLCRFGLTHVVCLKALDDYMNYITFWVTFVSSKELGWFLLSRVVLGVDGVMCWQMLWLVLCSDWGLFGVCWSVQVLLLMMNVRKRRKYFWTLAAIKVSTKIRGHLVQIMIAKYFLIRILK